MKETPLQPEPRNDTSSSKRLMTPFMTMTVFRWLNHVYFILLYHLCTFVTV